MKTENVISPEIEILIFLFRGRKVMVDYDLAILYNVPTKRLKEQVKRNIQRFPEDFMFVLTKIEKEELVANCDRLVTLKHSSIMPMVFTEQGVAI
ncbi:MAG TPA: ORF6N domain-containing protein [Saprospiraceae bacterium]|nr:ORF6N domain-containing protein [Saprospiraceae bacterium]